MKNRATFALTILILAIALNTTIQIYQKNSNFSWMITPTTNNQPLTLKATKIYMGNEKLANTNITGDQTSPRIDNFLDGSFVIVWESNGQDGDGYGIYFRIGSLSPPPVDYTILLALLLFLQPETGIQLWIGLIAVAGMGIIVLSIMLLRYKRQ